MGKDKLLNKIQKFFSFNGNTLKFIRQDYEGDMYKTRDFKIISKFFRMNNNKEYILDDQTWADLDMNSVYKKLDNTYSSLGEEVLYYMLRTPIMEEEELIRRNTLIRAFKHNEELREKVQCITFDLGRNQINTFLNMIEKDLTINKFKYYLYTMLGKILPCVLLILSILVNPKCMIGVLDL